MKARHFPPQAKLGFRCGRAKVKTTAKNLLTKEHHISIACELVMVIKSCQFIVSENLPSLPLQELAEGRREMEGGGGWFFLSPFSPPQHSATYNATSRTSQEKEK